MAKSKSRFTSKALFTWFLLGAFVIFLSPQAITGKTQLLFARIFSWPLNLGRNIMLSAVRDETFNQNLSQREVQYINQIANLQARIAELEKKYEQVAGVRAKFGFEGAKFIAADITKSSNTELIIDRGSNDQITDGLFVFGDNSIIGIIGELSASSAKVKLITSPACKLEVKIGDRAAVMQGDGKDIKIKTLPRTYPVKAGDVVYCQPKPGLLNTPIIVGVVSDFKTGDNAYRWDITVRSAANIAALTSVGVIKY